MVKSVIFDESGPYKDLRRGRPLDMTMSFWTSTGPWHEADYIGIKPSIDADSGEADFSSRLQKMPEVQPEYCW
jgi:hypothetical protein